MNDNPVKVSVAVPRSPTSIWGSFIFILLLAGLLSLSILNFVFYPVSTLGGLGARYWLLPWIVFVWILLAGVRYVKQAYDLRTSQAGLEYLLAATLGLDRPRLLISEGQAVVRDEGKENPLYLIGGPGYLIIETGNVALLENYAGRVRVVGSGRNYVSHLETLKEAMSLDERSATVEKITAHSKDGIEVVATNIRYRYCLYSDLPSGRSAGRTLENPYPYSEEAVINAVYNRNMTATEILPWHHGVNYNIDTAIVDYIRRHQVDQITTGSDQGNDSRAEIYKQLRSKSARERLKERGAELIWIDIGYLGNPDKQVMEQRVSNWQTKWMGDANVVRAYGEAQRIESQVKGRAEAQVDMIISMVKALEELENEGVPRQNLRTIYLARLSQLLESSLTKPALSPGDETP
jgi:hypothetical protein